MDTSMTIRAVAELAEGILATTQVAATPACVLQGLVSPRFVNSGFDRACLTDESGPEIYVCGRLLQRDRDNERRRCAIEGEYLESIAAKTCRTGKSRASRVVGLSPIMLKRIPAEPRSRSDIRVFLPRNMN
jgi:hypothetical protein